jgi:DNA-binding FadR family transcriptional regulator
MVDEAGFRRIEPKALHKAVQDQICDLINAGVLTPGQTLPSERELSQQLGVSRNSLREALRVLEARGIVVTKHGVGRSIRDVDPLLVNDWGVTESIQTLTVREVLETRALLEPHACALASVRRSHDELAAIKAAADHRDTWEDNVRFHHAVAAAANNYVLTQLILQQMHLLQELRQRDRYTSRGDAATLIGQHQQIAQAIEDRDAERAKSLMEEHLLSTSRVVGPTGCPVGPAPVGSAPIGEMRAAR